LPNNSVSKNTPKAQTFLGMVNFFRDGQNNTAKQPIFKKNPYFFQKVAFKNHKRHKNSFKKVYI